MTTPEVLPPAAQWLDGHNIPYRIFRHSRPVHSLAEAAAARGHSPEQVIRSIVFRLGEGQFVMALAAGEMQVHWPSLRKLLGVTRISMASPDEVLQASGYRPGTVSPFGNTDPVALYVDPAVFLPDELSLGSGAPNTALILSQADFQSALDKRGHWQVAGLTIAG